MSIKDFHEGVKRGRFPTDKNDLGPFTSSIQAFLRQLMNCNLLSFSGTLDDKRFQRVSSLDEAERHAYEPEESEFNWEVDRRAVWGETRHENIFMAPDALKAYQPNFNRLYSSLNAILDSQLPEAYRYECFDATYADLVEIVNTIAYFGQLDELGEATWEAYRQGGWPCGLTGGPATGDEELTMENRKVIVLWIELESRRP